MKELDNFTVERLEEIRNSFLDRIQESAPSIGEVFALIDIALAAKRAEPVDEIAFDMARGIMALVNETNIGGACQLQAKIQCFIEENLTTPPQLNSPEIPEGWIKCSDQMPEDDQVVAIVDAGHGCFYGGAVVSRSGPNFHLIGGLSAENYDGGAVVELDMEATHWMPLPTPPEKPL